MMDVQGCRRSLSVKAGHGCVLNYDNRNISSWVFCLFFFLFCCCCSAGTELSRMVAIANRAITRFFLPEAKSIRQRRTWYNERTLVSYGHTVLTTPVTNSAARVMDGIFNRCSCCRRS